MGGQEKNSAICTIVSFVELGMPNEWIHSNVEFIYAVQCSWQSHETLVWWGRVGNGRLFIWTSLEENSNCCG